MSTLCRSCHVLRCAWIAARIRELKTIHNRDTRQIGCFAMVTRLVSASILSLILIAGSYGTCHADSVDTTIGLTLDGLAAHHELDGADTNLLVPLPMLSADVDYRHAEIDVQTLPALPISLGGRSQQTQLGIFLATARYYLASRFMV